ncbi:MAG TPA: hypothetical protein VMZ22_08500 [Acidimicrobiales bacterium]|nr:hypothetical protein [Acidimicrobiales bacterium]
MSRLVIDPEELTALSALCRNASYDVAGIASEAQHHVDLVAAYLSHAQPAEALRVTAAVGRAASMLHRIAAELDDDAVAVAQFGQRGTDADALGDLRSNEHALLTRLTGEQGQPQP